jgi:uncharacterized membrane protein YcjF (UPF0283 family)
MLIFLAVWLLVLWIGSIALETTGMVRSKARFQALSCLTGTGFTTREAESVVNHPQRRRIATWLIFIGNAGIISGLIVIILYVRAGISAPSLAHILVLIGLVIVFIILGRLRVLGMLTNAILKLFRRQKTAPDLHTEEFLHQSGDYAVAHIAIRQSDKASGTALKDTGFQQAGISVLAIEREDAVLPSPADEESILPGDYLLCYGRAAEILRLTR